MTDLACTKHKPVFSHTPAVVYGHLIYNKIVLRRKCVINGVYAIINRLKCLFAMPGPQTCKKNQHACLRNFITSTKRISFIKTRPVSKFFSFRSEPSQFLIGFHW